MKRFAIAALLTLLAAPFPVSAELKVQYDRFKKSTQVSTVFGKDRGVYEGKAFAPVIAYSHSESEDPASSELSVILGRVTSPKDLRYKNCLNSDWLVDDQPFSVKDPQYGTRPASGGAVSELVIFDFDQADFAKLAAAKSIEVRICKDELRFGAETLHDLREVAKMVEDSAYRPAPYGGASDNAVAPRRYSLAGSLPDPPKECMDRLEGTPPADAGPRPTDVERKVREYLTRVERNGATIKFKYNKSEVWASTHCELGNTWTVSILASPDDTLQNSKPYPWFFFFRDDQIVGDYALKIEKRGQAAAASGGPRHYSRSGTPQPRNCTMRLSGDAPEGVGTKPDQDHLSDQIRPYLQGLVPNTATVTITKAPVAPYLEKHCELGVVWTTYMEVLVPESTSKRVAWPWAFYIRNGEIVGDLSLMISR